MRRIDVTHPSGADAAFDDDAPKRAPGQVGRLGLPLLGSPTAHVRHGHPHRGV